MNSSKIDEFIEDNNYTLEDFLGVNKNEPNLEDQLDSLVDEVRNVINGFSCKSTLLNNYNNWVLERKKENK